MDECYLRYDDYNFFNDTLDSQDTGHKILWGTVVFLELM